jgi:hypothetical protein
VQGKRGRLHNHSATATTNRSALSGHPTCLSPLNPTMPDTKFQKMVRAYRRVISAPAQGRWGRPGG